MRSDLRNIVPTTHRMSPKALRFGILSLVVLLNLGGFASAQDLTLDAHPDKFVVQRSAGQGELAISGTAGNSVSTVEARVVRDADGTVILGWSTVDSAPTHGTWSGALSRIPEGGWYRVEVRDADAPSNGYATGERFGVGMVIACVGQSNMARMFTEDVGDGSLRGPEETPSDLTWRLGYGEPVGYAYERPDDPALEATWGPVTGSGGIRLANALHEATGVPVLILDYGIDFTGLDAHWNRDGFHGWTKLADALDQVGQVEALLWLQGTYEALQNPSVTNVNYKDDLDTFYARISARLGSSPLPMVVGVQNRGDYTQDDALDARFAAVRSAHLEFIDERPHAYPAGATFDIALSTRPQAASGHFWADGYRLLADRMARGVLHAVGAAPYGPGGASIDAASVSGRVVTVTVAHDQGTRLTLPDPTRDIEGFELTDGTWGVDDLAIERAVLTSSEAGNEILITLDREPTGPLRLRYFYGQNPSSEDPTRQERRVVSNWLYDDFTYAAGRTGLPVRATATDLTVSTSLQRSLAGRPPAASADRTYVAVGGTVTIDILANDLDPEGALDPGSVTLVTSPSQGSIVAVDPSSGRITYRHTGDADVADGFAYTVADAAGGTSLAATVEVQVLDSTLPPFDGRVLHLEADRGLATDLGGLVTAWDDLSGHGNRTSPGDDPSLVAGCAGGAPCVRFDGTADKLERTAGLSALPGGNADRTVFSVVQYRSTGFGGVAWGSTSQGDCANLGNRTFGLIVDPSGDLTVQGWCVDFESSAVGTGQGWLVQSAVHSAGTLRHFKDGQPIDTRSHTFDTDADGALVIGAELDSSPYLDMDVAALLIYDRALDDAERLAVESYLQEKYLGFVDNPPSAVDDGALVGNAGSTTVDVLTNDGDDLGLVPSSVTVVTPAAHGSIAVDPATGAITYTHDGSATTSDAFTYTVEDTAGQVSNVATVGITVSDGAVLPTAGLVLHVEGDRGVDVQLGDVTGWTDQSPRGNHLVGAGGPSLIAGTPSGRNYIAFDGSNDRLERLAGLEGIPGTDSDRTVLAAIRYRGTGFGGISWGQSLCNQVFGMVVDNNGNLTVQGWCRANDFRTSTPGTGAGWMVQSVVHGDGVLDHYKDSVLIDTQNHNFNSYANGTLRLGSEVDGSPHVAMDLAAVVIYNRALSPTERLQAETYLTDKYLVAGPPADAPPTAADDTATLDPGTSVVVDVLTNDTDDNGLDATAVAITSDPSHGAATVDPSTGAVTYTHDGSNTTSDSFTYTVDDTAGQVSNTATVHLTIHAPTDDPPVARDDSTTVSGGGSVAVDVLANDGDDNGLDAATVAIASGPSHGAVAVHSTTGTITYTHDGSNTLADSFTYTVHDTADQVSNTATVSVTVSQGTLPTSGLVLHLESDSGVEISFGDITAWQDQSPMGNDLTGSGGPQLQVAGTPSGADAVVFDGSNDRLERLASLEGIPGDASDRSVLAVVRYRGTGFGGISWGQPICNQVFGVVVDNRGDLTVQGWCRDNDFRSTTAATDTGWMLHTVTVGSNTLEHYRDGALIDSQNHAFDTYANGVLRLGSEVDGSPHVAMDLAAVLIYDRALSAAERAEAEAYLSAKYLTPPPPADDPPVARDDSASVDEGSMVAVDVLANDGDDNGLAVESVSIVVAPLVGAVTVDPGTGAVTYTHDGSDTTADSFAYTVRDSAGQVSNTATVTVDITPVNDAPVAQDDDSSVEPGASVVIAVLANDRDDGGLDGSSVVVIDAPLHGVTSVDSVGGTITYTHDGSSANNDSFTYRVSDLFGATATATVTITVDDGSLPATGLVLHLESDRGVAESFGEVATWFDQTDRGNDVFGVGGPRLITTTPTGQPAIALDGVNDRLERLSRFDGLPTDNGARTVFTVVRYNGVGFGGISWGSQDFGDCAGLGNRSFGLVVTNQGDLGVQGFCSGNDFPTDIPGTGAGWVVQSAKLEGNTLRHYLDGILIDQQQHTFATDADGDLVIGAEIDLLPAVAMDVAGVLIYDRALGEVERTQVENYLQEKYLGQSYAGAPPAAVDDLGTVETAGAVLLDVLANDLDEAELPGSGLTITVPPTHGTITAIDPVSGVVRYDHDGSDAQTDTFTYTVRDLLGNPSNPATVTLVVVPEADGLVLHLDGDAGLLVDGETGEGDTAVGWYDLSGHVNDLGAVGAPTVVRGGANGKDLVSFDGSNDRMETVQSLFGLPSGNADRTVFFVVAYTERGFGGLTWGSPSCGRVFGPVIDNRGDLAIQGWCGANDFRSGDDAEDAGLLVQSVTLADGRGAHYRDGVLVDTFTNTFDTDGQGVLVIGAEIDGSPNVGMDVAAALVYDRALDDTERQAVEAYLQAKFLGH